MRKKIQWDFMNLNSIKFEKFFLGRNFTWNSPLYVYLPVWFYNFALEICSKGRRGPKNLGDSVKFNILCRKTSKMTFLRPDLYLITPTASNPKRNKNVLQIILNCLRNCSKYLPLHSPYTRKIKVQDQKLSINSNFHFTRRKENRE